MEFFLQLVLNGLVVGSIYSLVGLGFVVIYKSTSVLNFAQGEFLVLGAYVCLAIIVQLPGPLLLAPSCSPWSSRRCSASSSSGSSCAP